MQIENQGSMWTKYWGPTINI